MINKLKQWAKNIAKDIGLKLLETSGENYGPVLYEKNKSLAAIIPPQNFKPKKSLLSKNEKKLFVELCKAYKNDGYVFPEFCFEKLVEKTKEDPKGYIFVLKKLHADFVIVSKTFEVQCVVECDSAPHSTKKYLKEKDRAQDDLLQKWNIPVARIAANGTHTSEELRAIITNAIMKIK